MKNLSKITDVVELATAFINIESITGNEYPMYIALKSWLEPRGWKIIGQKVENNRYNLLAYPNNSTKNNIKILVNSHIDTVPQYFKAFIKNNKLYGRGSCDTKSIIASQIIALNNLKNIGYKNIGLLYTVGEEVNSIGMLKANELNLKPKYLITGEPTQSKTIKYQKGNYVFQLISKGKECHSGYPERGQCALTPLITILNEIQTTKWPINKIGKTTFNIHINNGGIACNIVPGECMATILFRLTVNSKIIKNKILNIINKYGNNQIKYNEIMANELQKYNIVDNEYDHMNVAFGTDITSFKSYLDGNTQAVLYGPGSIEVAHSAIEHIDIDELRESVGKYEGMVKKLLKVKSKL